MATDKIVDPSRGVRNVLIVLGAVLWLTGLLPVFWSGSLVENILMYSVFFLAGISHISVENKQHEVNDAKNKTGLIAGPKTIFYGKERGSIGTRTLFVFPYQI